MPESGRERDSSYASTRSLADESDNAATTAVPADSVRVTEDGSGAGGEVDNTVAATGRVRLELASEVGRDTVEDSRGSAFDICGSIAAAEGVMPVSGPVHLACKTFDPIAKRAVSLVASISASEGRLRISADGILAD